MEKQEEANQKRKRESYSNWQRYQDRRNEKEEARSDRRSRNSRDNLIEAGKERGNGRNQKIPRAKEKGIPISR